MALSEEQQETLVAEVQSTVERLASLSQRHHKLVSDCASLQQLKPPVSGYTGPGNEAGSPVLLRSERLPGLC